MRSFAKIPVNSNLCAIIARIHEWSGLAACRTCLDLLRFSLRGRSFRYLSSSRTTILVAIPKRSPHDVKTSRRSGKSDRLLVRSARISIYLSEWA